MKSRKELLREYKERPKPAGVFGIRNLHNGRVLLGSSKNLEGPLNRHRFMLSTGMHPIKELQRDWNEFGAEGFAFEILEEVKGMDAPGFDLDDELTLLEQIWMEKCEPFEERCYNTDRKLRMA